MVGERDSTSLWQPAPVAGLVACGTGRERESVVTAAGISV